MDSKIVTREIRRFVWPRLKKQGFTEFSARTAWRHSKAKIDVVNFQSFNSYLAGVIGCTTYSFALNLGCYYLAIRGGLPVPFGKGVPFPYHRNLSVTFVCTSKKQFNSQNLREPTFG
jgi:hypothetical protein